MLTVSIKCPFDDDRLCLHQGCDGCEVKLEAMMHCNDPEPAVKVLHETMRRNGWIATLRRARKNYKCSECGLVILAPSYYYEVVVAGGGLRSLKFPDHVHVGCVEEFLKRGEK